MTSITVYRFEEINNGNSRWRYTLENNAPESSYGYDALSGEKIGATVERGYAEPYGILTLSPAVEAEIVELAFGGLGLSCRFGKETTVFTADGIVAHDAAEYGLGKFKVTNKKH